MVQEESEELFGLDIVTIASVTEQECVTVSITVDELDVLKFSVGQAANVTVGALPGQQFTGTVTDISASGENEGGNSKFTATITLDKIPEMERIRIHCSGNLGTGDLHPGSSADGIRNPGSDVQKL